MPRLSDSDNSLVTEAQNQAEVCYNSSSRFGALVREFECCLNIGVKFDAHQKRIMSNMFKRVVG